MRLRSVIFCSYRHDSKDLHSHIPSPRYTGFLPRLLFPLPTVGEAAASTGAWPPPNEAPGSSAAAAAAKRKALPAWLRDELERLEKQKQKKKQQEEEDEQDSSAKEEGFGGGTLLPYTHLNAHCGSVISLPGSVMHRVCVYASRLQ